MTFSQRIAAEQAASAARSQQTLRGFGQSLGAILLGSGPVERELGYFRNYHSPNVMPTEDVWINAWWRYRRYNGVYQEMAWYNGVDLPTGARAADDTERRAWEIALNVAKPQPTPADYRDYFLRRGMNPVDHWLGLQEITGLDEVWCREFLTQTNYPDESFVVAHRLLGHYDESSYTNLMKQIGWQSQAYRNWLLTLPEPHNVGDVLVLVNRGFMTQDEGLRQIKANGFKSDEDAQRTLNLRYWLPSPSDLIHYLVKDAFDEQVVRRYGYDQGFPNAIRQWSSKLGMDYAPQSVFPGNDFPAGKTWAEIEWRAHWNVLSPTQAAEALRRCRPVAGEGGPSIIPGVDSFTRNDFQRMLQIADYAPGVRQWLEAISYNVLTRTDVRRMVYLGIMSRDEAVSAFQDAGYTARDAGRLADFTLVDTERSRESRGRLKLLNQIVSAWDIGVLTDAQLQEQAYPLVAWEELARLRSNPPANLARIITQHAEDRWTRWLKVQQSSRDMRSARETVRQVKRAFLNATASADDCRKILSAAGISDEAIKRYLQSWGLVLSLHGRRLTASQLLTMLKDGIMEPSEVAQGLERLGYDDTAVRYLMGRNRLLTDLAHTKAAAQAEQRHGAQQRLAAAAIKSAARELKAQQRSLAGKATPQQVAKWAAKGIVPPSEAGRKLALLGWSEEEARNLIAAALLGKNEQADRQLLDAVLREMRKGTNGQRGQNPTSPASEGQQNTTLP